MRYRIAWTRSNVQSESTFIQGHTYDNITAAKKGLARYLKEKHMRYGMIVAVSSDDRAAYSGFMEITSTGVAVFTNRNGQSMIVR